MIPEQQLQEWERTADGQGQGGEGWPLVVTTLIAEVRRLRELCRDVAVSGVAFEDPRISYVEAQIDVDTWRELQELRSQLSEPQAGE